MGDHFARLWIEIIRVCIAASVSGPIVCHCVFRYDNLSATYCYIVAMLQLLLPCIIMVTVIADNLKGVFREVGKSDH